MIRLSQLFKRDSQPNDGLRASSTRSRTDAKFSSRSSRATADDPVLTEDPEHQRARHRLIGAAVLVLVAIIVLPRVLDSKPKTVSNDIAVTIVSSLPAAPPQPASPPSAEPKSEEAKAPPPAVPAVVTPAPAIDAKESSKTTPPASAVASPAKPIAPNPGDKTMGLAAGEEIVVSAKANASASANGSTSTNANPSTPGKFVIQIGAFASEERANGWIAKLKEQKIPNYVLNRTGTDGSKLYALRAGPFTDKEAAEAAEKKIKAMGLTPRVVEVGKQ
jgi:DedD protein